MSKYVLYGGVFHNSYLHISRQGGCKEYGRNVHEVSVSILISIYLERAELGARHLFALVASTALYGIMLHLL